MSGPHVGQSPVGTMWYSPARSAGKHGVMMIESRRDDGGISAFVGTTGDSIARAGTRRKALPRQAGAKG
jgi:hypothetical protein